jgi:hypothetical protein
MRERELRDAASANFVTHVSWAASRSPGANVESSPSLTVVHSGLCTDTFNVVCGARLHPGEVEPIAGRILRRFRSADRPFSWRVSLGDLATRLAESGFEELETERASPSGSLISASSVSPSPPTRNVR